MYILRDYEFEISGRIFLYLLLFLWVNVIIVELSRSPVDFIEGESELVSGYNLEYSGVIFVFFFLREYGFILFYSVLTISMYFIASFSLTYFRFYLIILFIIFLRRCFPRYRYDLLIGYF